MSAREDSVLTSLNELRRLKNERRKHGGGRKSGRRAHDRESGLRHLPASDVTPPPRAVSAPQAINPHQQHQAAAAPAPVFAPSAGSWTAPAEPAVIGQMIQPKSSAKPAIIVGAIMLVAGIAGYVKMDSDWQSQLRAKEALVRTADETKVQAVEAAVRSERQALSQLKSCESKVHAQPALPGTAAAVVTPTVTPSAPVYPPPGASRGRHGKQHVAARPAPAAQPAPAPASSVPIIPKKKKLDNDPLSGIKI